MSMTYTPLQLIPPLPPSQYDLSPYPTSLSFDAYADLLYVGTSSGTVQSYCSPLNLSRHVTYPAHGAKTFGSYSSPRAGMGAGEVKQIEAVDKEVWSLTEGGIGGRKRNGLARWSASDPSCALRTFTSNPTNSHEILTGGSGPTMLLINILLGEIVKKLDQPHPSISLVSLPRSVLSVGPTGIMQILDPRSGFRAASTLSGGVKGSGGLTGVDVQGDMVATWGWSMSQGQPSPDTSIELYDIRTGRSFSTLSFPPGASFAKINPIDPSKIVVASAVGEIHVLDVNGGEVESVAGLNVEHGSYLTSFAISPGGDYLAAGDVSGQVHLLTSHDLTDRSPFINRDGVLDLPPLNGYEGATAVEWPDIAAPLPEVRWTDRTPLNTVGVPFYTTPLLSNFSTTDYATYSSPLLNRPAEIPQTVLGSMRIIDGVGYAPLPRELRGKRNVVCKSSAGNIIPSSDSIHGTSSTNKRLRRDAGRRESGPKFRSEQSRAAAKAQEEDENGASPNLGGEDSGVMPKHYRKVEIKYSKFGVEDFDFEFYNKTRFSGLETHISNSYTNSLLQALHYAAPIRACAKAHIATDCAKENCLLCESGFLFRMLEDAQGINCQASNFSRAFSSTSQAMALGLFASEEENVKTDYSSLIQTFHRWLLTTYAAEDGATSPEVNLEMRADGLAQKMPVKLPPVSQMMALTGTTVNTCMNCDQSTSRPFSSHVIDLLYPRKGLPASSKENSFASVLQASLVRDSTSKPVCGFCKKSAVLHSKRNLSRGYGSLSPTPAILSLNASILSEDHRALWSNKTAHTSARTGTFLPETIHIRTMPDGNIEVTQDEEDVISAPGRVTYSVRSLVAKVQGEAKDEGHLVAYARAASPIKTDSDTPADDQWHLFNDFLVRKVSAREALDFSQNWRTPAIILLERVDSSAVIQFDELPSVIDTSILLKDVSVARRKPEHKKHECFKPAEIPTKGTLVAIDAEFVALQLEELEIRSDGTKKVLRPTKMSLARVSVLRGQGDKEGLPFIDDYIHTSDRIADYLTEYSGIKDGDLDPLASRHTLVPLKVAYKKLRLLVDMGCIFIGHGLPKDFRTINIFVPPEQVIDTVSIYYDPARHRKLSLRFLSWFLLKQDIQLAEHDSIEDAKSALQLYKMYLTFEREGRFQDVMEDIFESGGRLGFKPPQVPGKTSKIPSTPSSNPSTPEFPPIRPLSTAYYPSNPAQHHSANLQYSSIMGRPPQTPPTMRHGDGNGNGAWRQQGAGGGSPHAGPAPRRWR